MIPLFWMRRVGTLCLPFVWALVSAVARGADDSSQTWRAFGGFARLRLWVGMLYCGAYVTAWFLMLAVFLPLIATSLHYVNRSGQLLDTVAAQSLFICMMLGPCFLPLLVLGPGLSVDEAQRLAKRALQINDPTAFLGLLAVLLGVGALLDLPGAFVPTYGLPQAAWLVFTGGLNYVAYRDIFERRDANLPQRAGATLGIPAPCADAPGSARRASRARPSTATAHGCAAQACAAEALGLLRPAATRPSRRSDRGAARPAGSGGARAPASPAR